jgi:hypothetical protein
MFEFVFPKTRNARERLSLGRKLSDFIEEDRASLEGSQKADGCATRKLSPVGASLWTDPQN